MGKIFTFLEFLTESIRQKEHIGKGNDHAVFQFEKLPGHLIKVKLPKNYDNLSFEIYYGAYKKNPDLVAKIFKMTDKYLIVEELDNKKIREEINHLKNLIFQHDDIANMFHYPKNSTNKYNYDNFDFVYNISLTLPYAHEVEEDPNNAEHFSNIDKIISLLSKIDEKASFLLQKYVDFIWLAKKAYIAQDIDVYNIGYDKNGKLKCLDV